MMFQAQNKHYK